MVGIFMIAKIQGVQAQATVVEKDLTKTKDIEITVSPAALGQIVSINPYNYSNQKKATDIMKNYLSEIAKEEKRKEEERIKKEQEETQKRAQLLIASYRSNININFADLYQRAGQRFGISPKVLQAVHIVETGADGSTCRGSYAGAMGPMQFMPGTFRAYGIDGNGDGTADICNVEDAIFSAANYLAANNGVSDIREALYHYNHSSAYINKVLELAQSL